MTQTRPNLLAVVSPLLLSAACAEADDRGFTDALDESAVQAPTEDDETPVEAGFGNELEQPQRGAKQDKAELRGIISAMGLAPLSAPPSVSDELFELGQALAFDKILSGNENISCLTCHHPDEASGDGRHLPLGTDGAGLGPQRAGGHIIPRNSPPLFNLHTYATMFWDSRVEIDGSGLQTPAGAELTQDMKDTFDFGVVSAQAMFPVTSREEMRGQVGENDVADAASLTDVWVVLMDRLGAIQEYVDMFEDAYPGTSFGNMTFAHAANALAGFEIRAFPATNTPWDRFVAGDDNAMSSKQLKGAIEFFEAGCDNCHSGDTFSDFEHHNTALAQFGPGKGDGASGHNDFGRMRVTGDAADRYDFRTPPLRNVALTGPWGHDGQYDDLGEFLAHYDKADKSLDQYKIAKHVTETALYGLVEDNTAAVLDNIDDDVSGMGNVNHVKLADFMSALTDSGSRDLSDLVPNSVPSGLPVAD